MPRLSLPLRRVLPLALLSLLLAFGLTWARTAPTVFAVPGQGGVDPQALLSSDGHTATVTGTVDCSQMAGRPMQLRVTLTQPDTGVIAEGFWQKQCSDASASWKITLSVGGDGALNLGSADVAVLDYTDAVQWIGQTQFVSSLPASGGP